MKTEMKVLDLDTLTFSTVQADEAVVDFQKDCRDALSSLDGVALSAPAAFEAVFGELKGSKLLKMKRGKLDVRGTKKLIKDDTRWQIIRDAVYAVHPEIASLAKLRKDRDGMTGDKRKEQQKLINAESKRIDNRCQYILNIALDAWIEDSLNLDKSGGEARSFKERLERIEKLLKTLRDAAKDKGDVYIQSIATGMLDAAETKKKAWVAANKRSKGKPVPTLEGWAQSRKRAAKKSAKKTVRRISKKQADAATKAEQPMAEPQAEPQS